MLMMHRLTLRNSLFILCLLSLSFVADSFDSDFAPTVLCAAAWVAPVIAGIGAAGSAIGSLISQADANKANREIAQENREWQSGENEKSRQWEEKMWNAQNLYNTPSAAKARLKEAGFNPYLVESSNIGNGNATSAGSPSLQGAPATPEMKPLPFGEAFNNLGLSVAHSYNEAKSVDANSANQTAQANREVVETSKELYRTLGKDAALKYLSSNLKPINGNMDNSAFVRQEMAKTESAEANARLNIVNANIAQKFGEKKADVEIREREKAVDKISQDIMESAVRMSKMGSEISLNEQKVKESVSAYWRNLAEAGMFKKLGDKYYAETSTIDSLRQGLVDQLTIANNRADLYYQTESTVFEADEGVRGYLTSKEAKENRAKSAKYDNNRYVHAVERSSQIVNNWLPDFIVPITGSGISTTTGGSSASATVSGFMSKGY